MDTKLKMSVIMAAVDKITAPIKKVTSSTAKLTDNIKDTKAELDKLSAQKKDIEHFKTLKRTINTLKPELEQQQKLVDRLSAEYESATKPTRKMSNELKQAKAKLAELTTSLKDNRTQLKTSIQTLDKAGIKTNQLAAHTKKLEQKTDQYSAKLDQNKAKLRAVTEQEERLRAAQAKRAKALDAAGNMAVTGAGMTIVSQQTVQAVSAPLQVAAGFEAQISKVAAISRADDAQMIKITEQARALGSQTAFSASEVAQAQEYLAVAGFDTNKILAATPDMLKLAQAGNLDLARAADIASDALTAFNMPASEMGRMADVLALTSTTANTNVDMLGEALKTSAGVAGSFGGTVEEVSAMLGIMANSGIKASQAGTAISSMYARIASPPKAGQEALDQLGVSAFDAEGKLRALPDIIQDIANATNGMSDTETASLFKGIFGSEAGIMAGSKALIGAANRGDLEAYVARLQNAEGSAGQVAEKMSDNLNGVVKSWQSAMESMKISAGTALIPTIKELTQWVTNITRKVDQFAQENPELVKWLGIAAIAFAAITAVLGPLMIVISTVIGSYATLTYAMAAASAATAKFNIISALGSGIMKAMTAAQWLFNAAMAANPIGLVIVAVAALIALAASFVDDWGAVGQWFVDLWEGVRQGVEPVLEFIKAYFTALLNPIDTLKSAIGWLADWFSGDDEKTVELKKKVQSLEENVPAIDATNQQVNRTAEALPGVGSTTQQVSRTADVVPAIDATNQQVNRTAEALPGVDSTTQHVSRTADVVPLVPDQVQHINREVNDVSFGKSSAIAAALTASMTALPAAAMTNQVESIDATKQVEVVKANPLPPVEHKQITVEGDKIEINLAPTPGISSAEVAELIRKELERHEANKQRKIRSMLND